jgi:hypothetical protein
LVEVGISESSFHGWALVEREGFDIVGRGGVVEHRDFEAADDKEVAGFGCRAAKGVVLWFAYLNGVVLLIVVLIFGGRGRKDELLRW